jgi:hypothetical protein
MKQLDFLLLVSIACLGACGCGSSGGGAAATGMQPTPGLAADGLQYLTDDVFACAVVRPRQMLNSKLLASLPPEKVDALVRLSPDAPVDPREVEYALVALTPAATPDAAPEPFMVLKYTSQPARDRAAEALSKQGIARQAPNGGEPHAQAGAQAGASSTKSVIHYPDDVTIVVGTEQQIQRILAAKLRASPVLELLQAAGPESDLVAAMVVEPLRQHVREFRAQRAAGLPRGSEKLLESLENVHAATLSVSLDGDPLARVVIDATSIESADRMADTTQQALGELKPIIDDLAAKLASVQSEGRVSEMLGELIGELVGGVSGFALGQTFQLTVARPRSIENVPAILDSVIEISPGRTSPN